MGPSESQLTFQNAGLLHVLLFIPKDGGDRFI
jgi:hypothetical protein